MKDGEILGFLGPNGAGKTTTIQMLLGILGPNSGSITYFGKNFFTHREEVLEKVNFSSTYTNLPWIMTVKENLTFASYLYDIKDRKKRIGEIVELFRLGEIFNKKISELSSGQITRVNLAKAFLNFPKILLLDEPTASLDPEVAVYIREFLLEERKKYNISIVFTSHNMPEVEELCDRVIFINSGKIVADDKPANLAKQIQTSHVNLLITHGLDDAILFFEKNKYPFKKEKNRVICDVKENAIADFLSELTKKGVEYSEISIDKPTLEDYFIEMARRKYEVT
jgi:ABC-2 type transport system ATP-binding protein